LLSVYPADTMFCEKLPANPRKNASGSIDRSIARDPVPGRVIRQVTAPVAQPQTRGACDGRQLETG